MVEVLSEEQHSLLEQSSSVTVSLVLVGGGRSHMNLLVVHNTIRAQRVNFMPHLLLPLSLYLSLCTWQCLFLFIVGVFPSAEVSCPSIFGGVDRWVQTAWMSWSSAAPSCKNSMLAGRELCEGSAKDVGSLCLCHVRLLGTRLCLEKRFRRMRTRKQGMKKQCVCLPSCSLTHTHHCLPVFLFWCCPVSSAYVVLFPSLYLPLSLWAFSLSSSLFFSLSLSVLQNKDRAFNTCQPGQTLHRAQEAVLDSHTVRQGCLPACSSAAWLNSETYSFSK